MCVDHAGIGLAADFVQPAPIVGIGIDQGRIVAKAGFPPANTPLATPYSSATALKPSTEPIACPRCHGIAVNEGKIVFDEVTQHPRRELRKTDPPSRRLNFQKPEMRCACSDDPGKPRGKPPPAIDKGVDRINWHKASPILHTTW